MFEPEDVWSDVQRIRSEAPLIHNITNYVVMNTTANALLALGASPVMAHAIEEVEAMVGLARALVINIGTLSGPWIAAMLKAASAAKRRGIPVVLDPVGAGATRYRTEAAQRILTDTPPAIVRGNASEIRALYYAESETKGVDSRHDAAAAAASRRHAAAAASSSQASQPQPKNLTPISALGGKPAEAKPPQVKPPAAKAAEAKPAAKTPAAKPSETKATAKKPAEKKRQEKVEKKGKR